MVESAIEARQRQICRTYGAAFEPPAPGSKLGLALRTLGSVPLHGVRVAPTESTCGWYIHAGEGSNDADFYQPLCIEHLPERCPLAAPFLGLPPGWHFLTDASGFVDVWQ